jgi:hypothetical protein
MCDDGLVTISVCKRRHRRSNWKTIAKASLPLPTLLSSPFSGQSSLLYIRHMRRYILITTRPAPVTGDVLLKKHDADAGNAPLS